MQVRFERRSDFRPQRIIGVVGQKWRTSGYHCGNQKSVHALVQSRVDDGSHTLSSTFSSEFGQSIAKQTKRRSVSGYESGRRRSYSS